MRPFSLCILTHLTVFSTHFVEFDYSTEHGHNSLLFFGREGEKLFFLIPKIWMRLLHLLEIQFQLLSYLSGLCLSLHRFYFAFLR